MSFRIYINYEWYLFSQRKTICGGNVTIIFPCGRSIFCSCIACRTYGVVEYMHLKYGMYLKSIIDNDDNDDKDDNDDNISKIFKTNVTTYTKEQ